MLNALISYAHGMTSAYLNFPMTTIMTTNWQIKITNWSTLNDQEAIKAIRQTVFIEEQHVPIALEWDGLDKECLHVLVSDTHAHNVATARMQLAHPAAHIGRMSVLKPYRHQGIGSLMLKALLEQASLSGVEEVKLNAQTTAVDFYQRYGFASVGEEFQDAGIPHYKMVLKII